MECRVSFRNSARRERSGQDRVRMGLLDIYDAQRNRGSMLASRRLFRFGKR